MLKIFRLIQETTDQLRGINSTSKVTSLNNSVMKSDLNENGSVTGLSLEELFNTARLSHVLLALSSMNLKRGSVFGRRVIRLNPRLNDTIAAPITDQATQ